MHVFHHAALIKKFSLLCYLQIFDSHRLLVENYACPVMSRDRKKRLFTQNLCFNLKLREIEEKLLSFYVFSKLRRNSRIFACSFSLSCHMPMRLLLQACKKGTFYFLSHLVTLSISSKQLSKKKRGGI